MPRHIQGVNAYIPDQSHGYRRGAHHNGNEFQWSALLVQVPSMRATGRCYIQTSNLGCHRLPSMPESQVPETTLQGNARAWRINQNLTLL